jgi:sec-independent protein translocase protein TatA
MINEMTLAIGGLGNTEILLILLVIVLLFGASRLPQLAKALGQSKRAFKDGIDEADDEARIAEARRRDRLPSSDAAGVRDDVLASDRDTVNRPR